MQAPAELQDACAIVAAALRILTASQSDLDTFPAASFRRDARVIGVVSLAHGLSHFLQLALPPLFPLLKAEFDVSWTLLGFVVGVFYVVSGIVQFIAGFAVDRFGARPVLLSGMALLAAGTLAASLAPDPLWLIPCVALMGAGNGVFHPSDFAILNANVAPRRLGHAYSSHGASGNLGYALAPIVSFGLGTSLGWRIALAAMGVLGLVVLGILATQRHLLTSQRAADAHAHTVKGSANLFLQAPIVLCFFYFVFQTMGTIGVQTFVPAALNVGLGIPLVVGTSAVTAYLLGGTAGIVAGGFLAVRASRHDLVAAGGLLLGATLVSFVGTGGVRGGLVLPLFALAGLFVGATGPSRDLIVRNATPKGAAGRVYGFVYSGLDTGAMLGPVWFGMMLDHGFAQQVFYMIAALFVVAIGTVVQVRRAAAPRAA